MIEWLAGVGYEAPCIECMQEGSHDSAIDARTALDLVHLKIKHGEGVSATHHAWVRFKMCMAVRNRCPLRGEQSPNTYHPLTIALLFDRTILWDIRVRERQCGEAGGRPGWAWEAMLTCGSVRGTATVRGANLHSFDVPTCRSLLLCLYLPQSVYFKNFAHPRNMTMQVRNRIRRCYPGLL